LTVGVLVAMTDDY
jgi:hypothetical protein